ncbi:MAG TPA: tryptophan halogenase family protein [Roseiarcus sp.]|nr:tryptophan halogenase family protein [Roseiarcus sp.]
MQAVQNITIVGGGTAGWLTALMLHTRLNWTRQGPPVQVALIESPNIPIIGVGEGCLPGIMAEFQRIGLDEQEFIRRCNATFKFGVNFVNWNLTEDGKPGTFVHPVSYGDRWLGGISPLYYYLAHGAHGGHDPHNAAASLDPIVEAIRLNRAPRASPEDAYKGDFFRYAYHFDATKLAEYLRETGTRRGITHVLDDVDNAIVGDGEIISHLILRQRGAIPVELVIDCTGFRGTIISKILNEPFQSYSNNLLCDRAVPIQIPYRENEPIESSTSATALSAGWVWRIPLFNRIGTGYVYSSQHRSDDEAIRELCQYLGLDPEGVEPRVIQMRVGRLRRAWVGNCIAVGLSGGFIEPLEATAIMSIAVTAFQITHHFPDKSMPETLRQRFNKRIDTLYNNVRDFILMHYYLANRPEPFWRAARDPSVLTESLLENLEVWRYRLPEPEDLGQPNIFTDASYAVCLASKGFFRGQKLFMETRAARQHWDHYFAALERRRARMRALPSARDFLAKMRREQPVAA